MTSKDRRQGSESDVASDIPAQVHRGDRPWGSSGDEERGGTGLEPRRDDAVIGGGPTGSGEDPMRGPGIPDEAAD